jgi:hypothetical protein
VDFQRSDSLGDGPGFGRGRMTEEVSEREFVDAGIIMVVYCALCGMALCMAALIAIFGQEFVSIF